MDSGNIHKENKYFVRGLTQMVECSVMCELSYNQNSKSIYLYLSVELFCEDFFLQQTLLNSCSALRVTASNRYCAAAMIETHQIDISACHDGNASNRYIAACHDGNASNRYIAACRDGNASNRYIAACHNGN